MSLFQPPLLSAPFAPSSPSGLVPVAIVLSSVGLTKRKNGKFHIRVIGHPDYGLPFGQDRLILIWIASMATWQKDRVIRFRSAATILETFGLPKDGRYYKRLIAGFERIFYSTFYFANDEHHAEAVVITRTSFRFVKDLRLWFTKNDGAGQEPGPARHENVIVLSEEFWREIQEHPIPVDLNIVKALADSPGNLDLYIWVSLALLDSKGPGEHSAVRLGGFDFPAWKFRSAQGAGFS